MKSILFYILLFTSTVSFSQNGYTLEFESTVLFSLDTLGIPPNNTVRTKQYTVPAGMVLKINSGILSNHFADNSSSYVQRSSLKVGDAFIYPEQICCNGDNFQNSQTLVINEGGEAMSPIWANEGTLIILKYERIANVTGAVLGISGCWFGGVLFRKIPN